MKKILCIGEALIDFIALDNSGDLTKSEKFHLKIGGAPLNVAKVISLYGGQSYFAGAIGFDSFGKAIESDLHNFGINTDYLQKVKTFTTLAFVSLDESGERDFEFNRGADKEYQFNSLVDLEKFAIIHFSSATAFLGGKLESSYDTVFEYAVKNNLKITFDANYRADLFDDNQDYFIEKCHEYIAQSYLTKLSEEELYLLSSKKDFASACEHILNLGTVFLIVTLGEVGAYLLTKEKKQLIPSIKVNPIDTTGAGDAFIGYVLAMFNKMDYIDYDILKEIVSDANIIGALTTTNYGALNNFIDIETYKKQI